MSVELKTSLQDRLLSEIEKIRNDRTLFCEMNFNSRMEAIDYLEFHIIDRLHALIEDGHATDQMKIQEEYAQKVKRQLEEVNNKVFLLFRKKIQEGYKGKVLMNLIDEYFDNNVSAFIHKDITGYDNLDIFLNGILNDQMLPLQTKERESGMIYFQKTPAGIILALIERAEFKPTDVFFDLGSGLGQVSILVNLLGSVISNGVEIEPAYYNYAKSSVDALHLSDVEFTLADARNADYSSGTIFFMYTPFEGKMLLEVLENLQGEAKKRGIRIFTYGPCSLEVAKQIWLTKEYAVIYSSGEFCEFHSV
jgi:hypothetical protein